MAERRAQAFLDTGRVTLIGVGSRNAGRARVLAGKLGCATFADVDQLYAERPDAVLIEVPHRVQDELALGALQAGAHTLIGGCLASTVANGVRIAAAARERGLLVETGYEARYKEVWTAARELVHGGAIGTAVAIRSIALFPAARDSWYYDENESGGMPLTHMTYAFINPARWLFGEPHTISAFANRRVETAPGCVAEEMCTANLVFPNDVIGNMTAGYVSPGGTWWSFTIVGSRAVVEVLPSDGGPGELIVHRERAERRQFSAVPDAFVVQAHAFLDAIEGKDTCRNPPADSLRDLVVAGAIVRSARERRTIVLSETGDAAPRSRPAPAALA
jgi:predicted dehydrogenase